MNRHRTLASLLHLQPNDFIKQGRIGNNQRISYWPRAKAMIHLWHEEEEVL